MNESTWRAIARRTAIWGGGLIAVGALFVLVCNLWVLCYADDYLHERPFHGEARAGSETIAIVPGALVRGVVPSRTLLDRLQTALELYENGTVAKVLVSGDHGRVEYDEVGAMRHWLLSQGVPESDIILDHAGFRTLDTMIRARKVFGVRRAVVCTQRFHLARAVFLARRAGIDAHGVAADRMRYPAHYWNQFREALARPAAVVDSYVLHRNPKFL
jgi:SanA protein